MPFLDVRHEMKTLAVIPLSFLVAACSSTDVSKISPFSTVSNQTVSTLRPTSLKPLNKGLIFGDGISFIRKLGFKSEVH
jgi:hypothetical protein